MKNVIGVIGVTMLAVACVPAQADPLAGSIYEGKNVYMTDAKLSDLLSEATRITGYTEANSLGIQHLAGRDAQQQKEINSLEQNKVDMTEFVKDQQRQDSRMSQAEKNLSVTDARSIDNTVRIDKTEAVNTRQDISIDNLNKQASTVSDTLNYHGDVLSNHQQQIDQLGSRMSGEIAGAMNRANEAHKQAKIAQDQAAAALSVSGQQFDLNYDGMQTAVSAATFGGSTALSIGLGGKLSERVFLNGAITNAGSATGGVVSSTFRW